ncbi:MAG: DUF1684 domain-containing protein [Acidobacteria bacterium]|nr:DUF1684 domain-containing protein [Acidobacteriota bacterium]
MLRPISLTRQTVLAALVLGLAAWTIRWDPPCAAQPAAEYTRSVEAWRAQREADLKAEDGWLTLVGLYWLAEGPNAMGSDPASAIPLPPGSAPARLGIITLAGGTATFTPVDAPAARINGGPARRQVMRPQPGDYDVLTTGSLTIFVIKRGDRYGVRIKDRESPGRRDFAGLPWYPIRESFRVTARFVRHEKPTSIMIANVLGTLEEWPNPGVAEFTIGGTTCRLQAVLDGADAKELFFVFRDLTTGTETYPGGRFLYADMPKNGEVVLDFNKAHSPPCAFTPFATCPVPPKENALPVRIEAGERNPHR